MVVAEPVVVPSADRVDQPCGVQIADKRGELFLGRGVVELAPAFVVDGLLSV